MVIINDETIEDFNEEVKIELVETNDSCLSTNDENGCKQELVSTSNICEQVDKKLDDDCRYNDSDVVKEEEKISYEVLSAIQNQNNEEKETTEIVS